VTVSRGRTERWLEAHLGTTEVSHVLYGTIVGLALVLALQNDGYPSSEIIGFLVATAITISAAGVFSEAISMQARERHTLTRRDRRVLGRETIAEVVSCSFPAVFFVLAQLGVFSEAAAFQIAKWSGVALVCFYAFLADRLAGHTLPHAARYAASAAVIGTALIELKAAAH
jgi:hypothetical protein